MQFSKPVSTLNSPDKLSVLLFAAMFVLALGDGATAAGWGWDFANGLGFAAIAGLIYICTQSAGRVAVRYHQAFAYCVLLLVIAHALWFLLVDAIVLEYLKPGAPIYMWAGLLSLILLTLLTLSARPAARSSAFPNRLGFRSWHRTLSWIAIVAALCHTLGSGLYLRNVLQYCLLALVLVPVFLPQLAANRISVRGYSAVSFAVLGVFFAALVSFCHNVWQQ